jgi:hypothetical protein
LLNRPVLVLLLLTAVTGISAYLVYPKSTSVTVQGALQGIEVVGTTPLTAVDVEEAPNSSANGITLAVSLRNESGKTPEDGRLVLVVPSGAWGSADGCAPNALVCTPDNQPGFKDAAFTFPGQWVDAGSAQSIARYEVHLTIIVSDISPNLVQNAEYIATLLPPISVTEEQVQQHSLQYTAVPVNYSERVQRGENYTWKEGRVPVVVNGSAHFVYSSAGDLQSAVPQTLNTGIDLSIQDKNTNLVFIAGTLLGIAGGALVGAITESLRAR